MLNNIAIITTMRCDLKCQHCLRGFPKERPDFPLELLDKLLTQALPFGANHVGLTGGEPHLYPGFEKMVDKIVAYGYTWHFVSNGQETKPYLPLMERHKDKVNHVSLSIDSTTAAIHDEIRNRSGAFIRVVAAVGEYTRAGYSVHIAATLNRKNKGEVEALVKMAMDLGAKSIGFGGMIPTPWNQDLLLSDEESFQLWEKTNELQKQTGFDIRTVSALHSHGGVNFCNILNLRELTFNALGELVFCCDTINEGAVIGSLETNSLSDLIQAWLEQAAALQKHRTRLIAEGQMGKGFDTCIFCENLFLPQ